MASLFVGPDLEETSMKTLSKTIRISRLGTLVVATFALTGAAGRAMAAPSTPAAGSLDDAQIADRVLAFNEAEVQTADAVRGKLSTPPVWQLAQRMTVDDSAIDQKLSAFAGKNQQSGSDGVAHGQAAGADLSNLSGDALEKAYVDREIQTHQAMLNTIDSQLIPNAKSEDLQRRLNDVRAETQAQLEEAQKVQHTLRVTELMNLPPDPVGTL
jgi:putative membrane protein